MALTDILALEDANGNELFAIDASGNVTVVGTITSAGAISLGDDDKLRLGAAVGGDATMEWVSATDDLLFDLPTVTGDFRFKLGNDLTTSQIQVENNTGTSLWSVNGAGGITIGGDAGTEACNLFTGASAKPILIGNAASASMGIDAGVGALTAQADTTVGVTSGTAMTLTATTGGIILDSVGATDAIYPTLGTDTSATEFAVRDNSTTRHFIVDGAGDITIGATTGATLTTAGKTVRAGSATSTGLVTFQEGTSATEGWNTVVYEDTVSPAAIETALLTIPAGSIVDGVWAQVETALTGGGTTATWSIGITGDVDSFGTAASDDFTTAGDSLAQDGKWTAIAGITPLSNAGASIGLFDAAAVVLKLIGAATGGATAGDTALTVGTVRVRVAYRTALPMDNA